MRNLRYSIYIFVLIASGCSPDAEDPSPLLASPHALDIGERPGSDSNQETVPPPPGAVVPVPEMRSAKYRTRKSGGQITLSCIDDTISPPSMSATLQPGECVQVTKEVCLNGTLIEKADVLLMVDLTGSMVQEIRGIQAQIAAIIKQLATYIDDPAFGVITYKDYPTTYSSCGYNVAYGSGEDYPYRLEQAVDSDPTLAQAAVGAIAAASGGRDTPESYSRVLWETWNDAGIGWRPGAQRIAVNFGDDIPHDCNLYSYVGLNAQPPGTGLDPGRDAVVHTADDISILTAVDGMAANKITLIHIHSSGVMNEEFDAWEWLAARTPRGDAVLINADGTVPGGILMADLIQDRVLSVAESCTPLTLAAQPADFSAWIQNLSPSEYADLMLPLAAPVRFSFDLCVPAGTSAGVYTFEVCALCGGGSRACAVETIRVQSEIKVKVDIHPASCPNPLSASPPGVIPVAILGAREFSVAQIDPLTVQLQGVPALHHGLDDVAAPYEGEPCGCTTAGPDGLVDLMLQFPTADVLAALGPVGDGEVVLTITGRTADGTPIAGSDCVVVRAPGE